MRTDHRPARACRRSHGIALISAMMVIAIVSASSTWLVRSQIINLQRSERVINSERAFVIALGVEDMVRELLLEDLQSDAASGKQEDYYIRRFDRNGDGYNDKQEEKWSLPFSFSNSPVRGVDVRWCVHDLSGFIDVNKLASKGETAQIYTKGIILGLVEILFRKKEEETFYLKTDLSEGVAEDHEEDLEALEELILSQGIGVDTFALESANALADWFDPNNEVRDPGGAEIDDYLFAEREHPYLPANGILMAWSDEIRLVKGYQDSNYYLANTVLPYITAIPVGHRPNKDGNYSLGININTAPVEVVKAALRAKRRPSDVRIEEVFRDKMNPPYPRQAPVYYKFDDVKDFCIKIGINPSDSTLPGGGRESDKKVCDDLEDYFFITRSRFFQLNVEMRLGDTGSWSMQSLFYRHDGQGASQQDVFVLQRKIGRSGYYRGTALNGWRRCH